jgi:hypothetical protein
MPSNIETELSREVVKKNMTENSIDDTILTGRLIALKERQ